MFKFIVFARLSLSQCIKSSLIKSGGTQNFNHRVINLIKFFNQAQINNVQYYHRDNLPKILVRLLFKYQMVKKDSSKMIWQKQKPQSSRSISQKSEESPKKQKVQEVSQAKTQILPKKIYQKKEIVKYTGQNWEVTQKNEINQLWEAEMAKNMHLKVTDHLIEVSDHLILQLKQNVLGKIVLKQFISTNQQNQTLNPCKFSNELNMHALTNQSIENQAKSYALTSSPQLKSEQKQKISQFIDSEPFEMPKHFHNYLFNEIKPDKKRQLLINLNQVLLDPINIKYLNIYGSTGSGKTFTLKSLIKQKNIHNKILWMNGMSILNMRTKRLLSNIKQKFDSRMWEKFKANGHVQHKKFRSSIQLCRFSQYNGPKRSNQREKLFRKQNSKILVIDEYDQISHFQISDLLWYAYITCLKDALNANNFFIISKVIFVSNNFSCLNNNSQQISLTDKSSNQNLNLFVQNLVFRPFSFQDAGLIIQQKIARVNSIFREFVSQPAPQLASQSACSQVILQLGQFFESEIYGIFVQNKSKHIIRQISFGQDIDIRKILSFYLDTLKVFIEMLSAKKQRLSINQNNQGKSFKKCTNFLIQEKFIWQHSKRNFSQPEPLQNPFLHQDTNPTKFYVSQLQKEGRTILEAVYKLLIKKRQLKHNEKKYNQTKPVYLQSSDIKDGTNDKMPFPFQQKSFKYKRDVNIKKTLENGQNNSENEQKNNILPQVASSLSFIKRKENFVSIQQIYSLIKPNVNLQSIYPWVYEWQQIGLVKISNHPLQQYQAHDRFHLFNGYEAHTVNKKMKVQDNIQIQVLNLKFIEQGLSSK